MPSARYPWFEITPSDDIEQGDIFEDCPVFLPPSDLAHEVSDAAIFRWETRDLIVMSQSCDIVRGSEKVTEVLLCPVWLRSEITSGHLATARGLEDARRGNLPGYHLLAECTLEGHEREMRIVDFRQLHTLPLSFVRRRANVVGERLRLLPPYREHLSQAFARYFMRVGLPADIPPIR